MTKKYKVTGNTLANGDIYHPVPIGAEVTLAPHLTVFGGLLYYYTGVVHHQIKAEHVEAIESSPEVLPLPKAESVAEAVPEIVPAKEQPAAKPSRGK